MIAERIIHLYLWRVWSHLYQKVGFPLYENLDLQLTGTLHDNTLLLLHGIQTPPDKLTP